MRHVALLPLVCIGAGLALGATARPADDEIFACEDERGNVIYQDTPCVAKHDDRPAARVPAAAPPVPPAPEPVAAAAKPVPRRAAIPLHKVPRELRGRSPAAKRGAAAGQRFPTSLDAAAPSAAATFATPEQTWRSLLTAMRDDDRAAALACLTPEALARFGPQAESFRLEQLRQTVSTFTRIEGEGDLGPFWSIRALRANERPKWIFFERTAGGEWKIAGW